MIHDLALFGQSQQFRYGLIADRHIVEEPCKLSVTSTSISMYSSELREFQMFGRVAAGSAKKQLLLFQDAHGIHNLLKCALATRRSVASSKPSMLMAGTKL